MKTINICTILLAMLALTACVVEPMGGYGYGHNGGGNGHYGNGGGYERGVWHG